MEFLQANWLWLLLGGGVVWFLFRRGGMGCGMGGHGSHESDTSTDARPSDRAQGSHDGHGSGEAQGREAQSPARRRHGGC